MPRYTFDGVFDVSIEIPLSVEAADYDDAFEAASNLIEDRQFDLDLSVFGRPAEWRLVAAPYPIHIRESWPDA